MHGPAPEQVRADHPDPPLVARPLGGVPPDPTRDVGDVLRDPRAAPAAPRRTPPRARSRSACSFAIARPPVRECRSAAPAKTPSEDDQTPVSPRSQAGAAPRNVRPTNVRCVVPGGTPIPLHTGVRPVGSPTGRCASGADRLSRSDDESSSSSHRYPRPGSVPISRGYALASPSFWRRCRTWTRNETWRSSSGARRRRPEVLVGQQPTLALDEELQERELHRRQPDGLAAARARDGDRGRSRGPRTAARVAPAPRASRARNVARMRASSSSVLNGFVM